MSRYKLPPKQRPIRQSVAHLNTLRSRPEYAAGMLIDEAADAALAVEQHTATQGQRKRVSRQLRQVIHVEAIAAVTATEQPIEASIGELALSTEGKYMTDYAELVEV